MQPQHDAPWKHGAIKQILQQLPEQTWRNILQELPVMKPENMTDLEWERLKALWGRQHEQKAK